MLDRGNARRVSYLAHAPFVSFAFILPFPGTVAFRLVCLSLCVVVVAMNWRTFDIPKWPCRGAMVLWAAVACGSLLYAADFRYSLGELKNEVGYTLLTFWVFLAFTRDDNRLRAVLFSIALSASVIAIWAVSLRLKTGYWDEVARHGGSGAFGSLSVMLVPVLVVLWFIWPRARLVWICVAFVSLVAAYFSYQRAVWPIFGIQALLTAYLLSRRYRIAPNRKIRLQGAVVAVLIFAAGSWFSQGAKVASYGAAATLERDSRVIQWPAVIHRILENPLSGAGFGREAMKLGHPDLITPEFPHFWHAHNVFLNYGLEMGLLGSVVLMVLFAALIWRFLRMNSTGDNDVSVIGLAGVLVVVAVVFRNLTNDFFVRDASLLFWAICGALFGVALRKLRRQA